MRSVSGVSLRGESRPPRVTFWHLQTRDAPVKPRMVVTDWGVVTGKGSTHCCYTMGLSCAKSILSLGTSELDRCVGCGNWNDLGTPNTAPPLSEMFSEAFQALLCKPRRATNKALEIAGPSEDQGSLSPSPADHLYPQH